MTTLLLAELAGSALDPQTASALTAARALGGDVHVLVAGADVASAATAAAALDGVAKVLVADAPSLAARAAEPTADLILALAPGYDAIVAAATSTGKNVLPRVAALLDVMQVSDVIAVVAPDTFRRPTYAGNAIETVQAAEPKLVLTIRPSAFEAAGTGGSAPIEAVGTLPAAGPVETAAIVAVKPDRPELSGAKVIVSGGRAFGSKEKFDALLVPLAQKLGAAIGASRAAVDAGYAANDLQVGQTGKVVAPDLYIACGISGAIQHLAGMKDSRVIVAINSDANAPIFAVADYGLVGDLFTLLPELTEAL